MEKGNAAAGGVAFTNAERKGWLTKQGGRIKTWKRRWFILSDNCLFYFKTPSDVEPCGIIPLENVTVAIAPVTINKRAHCFMLQNHTQELMKACKVGSDGTLVKANHLVYFISASSQLEMDAWMSAINSNIHKNPFWELISKKEEQLIKSKDNRKSISAAGMAAAAAANNNNNNGNNNNGQPQQQQVPVVTGDGKGSLKKKPKHNTLRGLSNLVDMSAPVQGTA